MSTTRPDIGFAIDFGTTFSAAACRMNGRTTPISFPGSGRQLPTALFNAPDGTVLFGDEAIRAGVTAPDRLYQQFKRGLPDAAEESWHGGPTPIELTTMYLSYIWRVALQVTPALKAYVKEQGGTRPAELLRTIVTHPATYRQEHIKPLRTAASEVGIGFKCDGHIPEPVAASMRYRELQGALLNNGDVLAVVDIGGGTLDTTLLRFEQGKFEPIASGNGADQLGGINFTGAVYDEFSSELGIDVAPFDARFGLALNTLSSPEEQRLALAAWQAAEQAKLQLSTMDATTQYVTLPDGLHDLKIDRTQFLDLCHQSGDLYGQFKTAVADTISGSALSWSDVDHVLLVGGSSLLPGLLEATAEATERQPDQVFLSSDSAQLVVEGAVFQAAEGEETGSVLPGGLGVRLLTREGTYVNRMFFSTGEVIPVQGRSVSLLDQELDAPGGDCTVALELIEAKAGVKATTGSELQDDEIVIVKKLRPVIPAVPSGTHDVAVGFNVDINSMLKYTLDVDDNSVDIVSGVVLDADDGEDQTPAGCDLVMAIDVSSSMQGKKLRAAQDAAHEVLAAASRARVRVALVSFGAKVLLEARIGAGYDDIGQQIERLKSNGSTPMAEALDMSGAGLSDGDGKRRQMVLLVTDGHPNDAPAAVRAAGTIKQSATLFVIGIGRDVNQGFLMNLATTPQDFAFAKDARAIAGAFDQFISLYLKRGAA